MLKLGKQWLNRCALTPGGGWGSRSAPCAELPLGLPHRVPSLCPSQAGCGTCSFINARCPLGGHIGIWGRVKRGGSGSGSRPAAVLISVLEVLSSMPRFGLSITGSIPAPGAGASLIHPTTGTSPILGLEHLRSHGWNIPDPLAGTSTIPGSVPAPIWDPVSHKATTCVTPAGLLCRSILWLIRGSLAWIRRPSALECMYHGCSTKFELPTSHGRGLA